VIAKRIAPESVRRLEAAGCQVWVPEDLRLPEPDDQIAQVIDPSRGGKTLHWGRHYLYRSEVHTGDERIPVVVKQFRNAGLIARRRKTRGESKAARSWRAAGWLEVAGVPTPQRLAWIESKHPAGPSWYVSRYLPDRLEARKLIRSMNAGTAARAYPQVSVTGFLTRLGQHARTMHDAGIVFRDLSVGNILIRATEDPDRPELTIVDLNRARRVGALPLWRRMRDLSRLNLRRAVDRRTLLSAYCGEGSPELARAGSLLRAFQGAFETKQSFKRRVRAPLRWVKKVRPRRAHAHIPQAPKGASLRDRIVWDALSDQPHQHASRLERLRVRMADSGVHAQETVAALRALPRAWGRYRQIRKRSNVGSLWQGLGVAVRPWGSTPAALLDVLDGLGVRNVLLRLYPWQERHDTEEELARELAKRGYDLTFALPQVRELVLDLPRWEDSVSAIFARFQTLGHRYQLGQAINRSKWGVWNYGEFVELAAAAAEILHRDPDVRLLGPGVIDFEPHAMAAALNMPGCPKFDIVSALLYVDRRGAPENRQLGFDVASKAALMRAIGETASSGSDRFWITEMNWPLWEGPHSPAGRDVAVEEEAQADYLVRYAVALLAPRLAERVYWWQLIARGYGLVDPGEDDDLRRRPSWRAMKTLAEILAGSEFDQRLDSPPGTRLYRFHRDDRALIVGWSVGNALEVELPPGRVLGVRERDGDRLPAPTNSRIRLAPSPTYVEMERDDAP
jgi:tRNA A-37 threonylcarbamoyl transferase component Bud32